MGKKILVIDDNEDAGMTLKWAMKAMGHEVYLALNGKSALEMVQQFVPDVVLCDINMPNMLGYDVCKKMKADPRLCDTLFIAQTGLDSMESKQLSRQAGFSYHMVKPVDVNALLELVFFEKMQPPKVG